MKDTYSSVYGERDINAEAVTTGKFLNQGGIDGRTESTGLGVYYGIRSMLNDPSFCKSAGLDGVGIDGKTFGVQGYGNVGYWASKFLTQDGGKVEYVIEHDCAIYKKGGFDVDDLESWKQAHGSLKEYHDADKVELDDPAIFMEQAMDVLIPAAVEKSIHKDNAPKIQAKVIGEAANGPTTVKAETILRAKGIQVLPDLILNGGGVTVSYFEWLKNLQHVAPGRLTKRWEEQSKKNLYQ